jgi:hypothetical protein
MRPRLRGSHFRLSSIAETPAGCSSISISFGAATAASVPSNGRYASAAVDNAAMAIPAIAGPSADEIRLEEGWIRGHI